jgi:CDP-4-dehydro-6-deoxyglucose reductase
MQELNLSRAAQVLGVPRSHLQRLVRNGELASCDGMVSTDELRRCFPDLVLEASGLFESVAKIRDEAFGRRIRERALPSQEILAQRLLAQSDELADLRLHLQRYHALVERALDHLATQPEAVAASTRALLENGLAEVLASEVASPLERLANVLDVVSARVSVRPSGREFVAEGRDTLLQAGLKAGLRLPYGCGSGSCGLCKTRLVAGEVRQTGAADYRLSEAERQGGIVLSCACTPLGDVVIETVEAAGPADIPPQELAVTVRAITPLGADTLLLHLQTPRSHRLRFLAGQSVTLGHAGRGGDAQASWPIASCPCDDRNLHFHVGRAAADALAVRLFSAELRPGDRLNLRGPQSDFVLDPESRRPLVFLVCDLGFAPVKSLIEHAQAIDLVDRFGLVWQNTRADGRYLDNQCRMWAEAFDSFQYLPGDADTPRDAGREAALIAARALPYLADADVYLAGPEAFVDVAIAQLRHDAPTARLCATIVG